MLVPRNLTSIQPAPASLPRSAAEEETGLFPHFSFLPCDALLAAPTDEDEEDDEDDPEDAEDDLDEEEEDEDDYEDEEDDDEDDDTVEDDEQDEEDEDEDDEEDDEYDPDSDSTHFFLQPARSMPRNRMLQ